MPRPRKCRKVCCLPESDRFGPLNSPINEEHFVCMTVDEYETIRLIDLEGLTQEECASQMNIARTTVQGIYNDARKKLAELLVNGKVLRIEGGDYTLCNGFEKTCRRGGCCRRDKNFIKRSVNMKIAIATEGTNVSGHFGKCENFTIAEIENSEVKSKNVINTAGNQHGLLPAFLASHGVGLVVAGGMGEGARQNLISKGIEIITGINGNIDDVIKTYLEGNLISTNAGCSGHGHSHSHSHEEGGCSCGH